jgi:hypothetical protein
MKTRSLPPRPVLLALALSAVASVLPARIISYAPVTDRHAAPAIQHRSSRQYVLIESDQPITTYAGAFAARLVLYDSKGEREPRVVFPAGSSNVRISVAAVHEDPSGTLRILVLSDADLAGDNPTRVHRFLFSPDGGATWKAVPIAGGSFLGSALLRADVGGPVVRERGSAIRLGSNDFPFVLMTTRTSSEPVRIHAVGSDGSAKLLAEMAINSNPGLIGTNREGTRFLVMGVPILPSGFSGNTIRILDLNGRMKEIRPALAPRYGLEGWITPDGSVYLEDSGRSLFLFREGTQIEVATVLPGTAPPPSVQPGIPPPISQSLFAVPTFDFSGAWIIQRGTGVPTILSRHAPGSALTEQWRDTSGPEVEALHAGASGRKLLVQVHVSRPQADQRIFRDPALAVWEVGQGAPKRYDELFLVEGGLKGFVHLDVDTVAAGDVFVFDSAATPTSGVTTSPSAGGGGDVTQEWGVVRASLKQRLVVPAVGRLPGAFGTFWKTDLIVRNPSDDTISVLARFVPSSTGESSVTQPVERRIELGPSEIWLYADVLGSIFDIARGSGALFLTPDGDSAITATSRTYTDSSLGSYGMGVGAVDVFAAVGARFPVSFSGALQGADFRTNLVAVDTGGRGSEVSVRVSGASGAAGRMDFSFRTPAGGQAQLNSLGPTLEFPHDRSGAIVLQPLTGEVVASAIAIDNRTNDATYFPPDLPSPFVRTIPAIGHVDGANGSRFRSDLFLFNPSDQVRGITLTAKRWDVAENEAVVNLTLQPRESRTIRDVLLTTFGKTGIARLRYLSGGNFDPSGVRVTSRLYTIDASGGTYGLLIPPLNSFQAAGPGESLEILGPQGGRNFRTNLSLVELTAFAGGPPARARIDIYDDFGELMDSFETSVPIAGGIQILDIFRTRGIGNGPPAALIRISPLGGLVGAFATTLDNGTNDPTYYGAALGSR